MSGEGHPGGTGGEPLDADPASIRGFAENTSTLASNFMNDYEPASRITDIERFSESFVPGLDAQSAADDRAGEMLEALMVCHTNLLALSMASYTCADLLGTADNLSALDLNAIDFAFADPGATTPDGLPGYLADGQTLQDEFGGGTVADGSAELIDTQTVRTADGTAVVQTYRTADGGYRVVTTNSDGSVDMHITDADGNRLSEVTTTEDSATGAQWSPDGTLLSRTETHADGRVVTTTYTPAGQVAGRTEMYRMQADNNLAGYTEERMVTETYDAEGNRTDYTARVDRIYDNDTRETGTYRDGEFTVERRYDPEPEDPHPHGMSEDSAYDLGEELLAELAEELENSPANQDTPA